MKRPTRDELTADDREAVAAIVRHADTLADALLRAIIPDITEHRALSAMMNFARGSGLFDPSARHRRALQRQPPEPDVRRWREQEARLASLRDTT